MYSPEASLPNEDGSSSSVERGRPKKEFVDLSDRAKRLKIQRLAVDTPTSLLTGAAIKRSKASPGTKDLGCVITQAVANTQKAKKALDFEMEPIMMTVEEVLARKVQCD